MCGTVFFLFLFRFLLQILHNFHECFLESHCLWDSGWMKTIVMILWLFNLSETQEMFKKVCIFLSVRKPGKYRKSGQQQDESRSTSPTQSETLCTTVNGFSSGIYTLQCLSDLLFCESCLPPTFIFHLLNSLVQAHRK